jgi:hypothetical protein
MDHLHYLFPPLPPLPLPLPLLRVEVLRFMVLIIVVVSLAVLSVVWVDMESSFCCLAMDFEEERKPNIIGYGCQLDLKGLDLGAQPNLISIYYFYYF